MSNCGFADDHEYYAYWRREIDLAPAVSRTVLWTMSSSQFWPRVSGQFLLELIQQNKLVREDARWLLDSGRAPQGSFAQKQLSAYLVLLNGHMSWRKKLELVMDPNTLWAAERLVSDVPRDQQSEAWSIIRAAPISRGRRMRLLDALNRRAVQ